MMKKFFLPILLFSLTGCLNNVEDVVGEVQIEVSFSNDVQPILVANNCVGCHPGYNDFEGSVAAIMDGKVIERINLDISNPQFMPLGSTKLSQQELDIIQNFSELFCQ